jgi:5-methylcytosine-specific restriction endonuclease McrA
MKKTGVDKPKPKKRTTTDRRKLILELDALASRLCKITWYGRCGMCGGVGNQSHHFFGKKASGALRWSNENLVLLCLGCHIFKVHAKGETEPARDAIIKRIGQERFDLLKRESKTINKYSMFDLREIQDGMKTELRLLEAGDDLPF